MIKDELFTLLNSLDGVIAVGIFEGSGILVDSVTTSDTIDLDDVSAEFATILGRSRALGSKLGCEKLDEVSIVYKNAVIIVKDIKDDYFLGLAVEDFSTYGKARLELRKALRKLAAEI